VRGALIVALVASAWMAAAAVADAATPRCFGAAARDPRHPCSNPRLRLRVSPAPDDAALTPNVDCARERITPALEQCAFGVEAWRAVETVAVVGDSHAMHWRPALAVVAQERRWRVLEVAVPHCLFSTALTSVGEPFTSWCPQWNVDVLDWLGAHPELRTVIVSANVLQGVKVPDGQTGYRTRLDGYVGRWSQLPASVTSLIVIRDNPQDLVATGDCVRRAMARRRPAGPACAVRIRVALRRDPAVAAARRLRGRAHVVDLTRFFCDRRECFPVVGGVLVHRDPDHLTRLFAQTLGPYLQRRLDELIRPH
jgi:hypothetical protein